jgi:hypothetical protein
MRKVQAQIDKAAELTSINSCMLFTHKQLHIPVLVRVGR